MAGGVAIFDFDNDGKPDIFLANGARQPDLTKPDISWHNRLYRNLGNWRFKDVTTKAGVAGDSFSFGVAAADFDNDGYTDLFVTGMPRSHLYRNQGDGTFEDITEKAGLTNRQQWPVAAGWFDADNDGLLDLFVVNYVRWIPAEEPFCGTPDRMVRTYCHPREYSPFPNTLFRNNGNGTFADYSKQAGLLEHPGKGMAVAFADYDEDGDLDVFVGNDTTPSFLFRNDGKGHFTEVGADAGIALTDDGLAVSAMGADFRDIDNDGRPDLFVTALANETFPLFRNLGRSLFQDITYAARVGKATLQFSGWSAGMFDFDNDGEKDLFCANGDVNDNTEQYSSRQSRQRNLLLLNQLNQGSLRFESLALGEPAFHRGAAFADLDGDGAIDVLVSRLNQPPLLLRNQISDRGESVTLRLQGRTSNRDGIGAQIRIGKQSNQVTTAVGYASSSPALVHFGVGHAAAESEIEIRWPGGKRQTVLIRPSAAQVQRVMEP